MHVYTPEYVYRTQIPELMERKKIGNGIFLVLGFMIVDCRWEFSLSLIFLFDFIVERRF